MADFGSRGIAARPQKSVTVEGYVLDSACALQGIESRSAATVRWRCAKERIATGDIDERGSDLLAIDSATPAKGQCEAAGVRGESREKRRVNCTESRRIASAGDETIAAAK